MSFILQGGGTVANIFQATATGSIAKGAPVSLLTNGNLSASGYSSDSPTLFTASTSFTTSYSAFQSNAIGFDPTSGTVLASFRQITTGYLTVVAGKITGQTIAWGTPVVANSVAAAGTEANIVWDSTNSKFVLVGYAGNAFAVVCTVTGTSVSTGTPVDIATGTQTTVSACYDSANSKIIVAYATFVDFGYVKVGTVSGTTISFGAAVQIPSAAALGSLSCSFSKSASKTVIFFHNTGIGVYQAIPATTSGTVVTMGTASTGITNTDQGALTVYDESSQNVICLYSGNIFAVTLSGTVATNGTRYSGSFVIAGGVGSVSYDLNNSKINIVYISGTTVKLQVATTSGTVITLATAINAATGLSYASLASVWDSVNGRLLVTPSTTAATYSFIGYGTNYGNFLGFSVTSYTNGQQATINTIAGLNTGQTGLTIGSKYYVQSNGTISTTADTTVVYAGIALTTTAILTKG